MQAVAKPIQIPKEKVDQYRFLAWDILRTPAKRQRRYEALLKALTLGNEYHSPVKLYFYTADEELVCTEATIWMVGDNFISIKGGRTIPIHAIEAVDIY